MSIQAVRQSGIFCCPIKYPQAKKEVQKNEEKRNFNFTSYPKEYYISFSGGNSLNLAKTNEQINKLGEFPKEIENKINETLSDGNPENKTLKDIHEEKYSDLSCCDTIEELREFFPEFEKVKTKFGFKRNKNLSDKQNDSLKENVREVIKRAKAGKIDGISPNEDFSLQLTKMYWAQTMSLDDISKKLNTPKLYVSELFKGYNIPTRNKLYGYYLKMSDKETNANVGEKIATARQETAKQNASEQLQTIVKSKLEGEEAGKENIQNLFGQLRTYCNSHPNMPFSYTTQDYKYFIKHPTQAIVYNQIVQNALKSDKAQKLNEDLKAYLNKDELSLEDIADISAITYSKNGKMQDFWTEKHKNMFKGCMEEAMRHQKQLNSMGVLFDPYEKVPLLGNELLDELNKIFNKEGPHDFSLEQARYFCYNNGILGDGSTPEQKKALDWIKECFKKHPEILDKYSGTLQVTQFNAAQELIKSGNLDLAAEVLATLSKNGDKDTGCSYHKILDNHINDENNIIAPLFNRLHPQASKFVYRATEDESSKYENSTVDLVQQLGKAGYFTMNESPDGITRLNLDTTTPEAKKRMRFYVLEHPNVALGFSQEDSKYFEEHPEEKKYFFEAVEKAWETPCGNQIKSNFLKHIKFNQNKKPWTSENTRQAYEPTEKNRKKSTKEFFSTKPENRQMMINCLQTEVAQKYAKK